MVNSDGRLWRTGAAIPDHRPMPEWRIRKWSHVAWNDSRAGSLNSPALGGVERKEDPTGIRPSIGSSNKRPQLPRAGAVSLTSGLGRSKVLVEGDHAMAAVRWASGDGADRCGCRNRRRRGVARLGLSGPRGNKPPMPCSF
jgi:hypothetical protein